MDLCMFWTQPQATVRGGIGSYKYSNKRTNKKDKLMASFRRHNLNKSSRNCILKWPFKMYYLKKSSKWASCIVIGLEDMPLWTLISHPQMGLPPRIWKRVDWDCTWKHRVHCSKPRSSRWDPGSLLTTFSQSLLHLPSRTAAGWCRQRTWLGCLLLIFSLSVQ